jgi:hypothetical protein
VDSGGGGRRLEWRGCCGETHGEDHDGLPVQTGVGVDERDCDTAALIASARDKVARDFDGTFGHDGRMLVTIGPDIPAEDQYVRNWVGSQHTEVCASHQIGNEDILSDRQNIVVRAPRTVSGRASEDG